jgi:hypothetical protein
MESMAAKQNANEIHSKSMISMAFPGILHTGNYTQEKKIRIGVR